MGVVPPRIVQPADAFYALGVTAQEAADAMTAAFTAPWWGIWIDDGVSSERYGTSAYSTEDKAAFVCRALEEAYNRLCYTCQFSVRLRARELPAPRVDPLLIGKYYS